MNAERSETTRWAEASGTIQLLLVEAWGFSQKEYIETTTNGLMTGDVTTEAFRVPGRLTASSPESASTSDFAPDPLYINTVREPCDGRPARPYGPSSGTPGCGIDVDWLGQVSWRLAGLLKKSDIRIHIHQTMPGRYHAINVPGDNSYYQRTDLLLTQVGSKRC